MLIRLPGVFEDASKEGSMRIVKAVAVLGFLLAAPAAMGQAPAAPRDAATIYENVRIFDGKATGCPRLPTSSWSATRYVLSRLR
jgi:hypothetical protein